MLLAWCDGAVLPSYKLVSKNEPGKWVYEETQKRIKEGMFSHVMRMPLPFNWPTKDKRRKCQENETPSGH